MRITHAALYLPRHGSIRYNINFFYNTIIYLFIQTFSHHFCILFLVAFQEKLQNKMKQPEATTLANLVYLRAIHMSCEEPLDR